MCFATSNMTFNTFCNICFIKENIIKLCWEENEPILNILISFSSCQDIVNDIIYLCINCCNRLEEYRNFRELYLMNFVRFRYLYNQHKKQLEISNAPEMEIKLNAFVQVNVERQSGTPLIENCDAAHAMRNATLCNVDNNYKKESDEEFSKIDLDEVVNKNIPLNPKMSTLQNDTQICQKNYENYSFNENQENKGNSVFVKVEPNPDLFDESENQLETVANASPCHESADGDASDLSFNPESYVTDDSTDEEGSADNEIKKTTNDIVCNVCNESFSCNSDLDVHMRTHTDEKHSCDKCHKTFTDTAKLRRYKRSHRNKKNKCDECGYRRTQRLKLNIHKRTHIGEKPFKCDECGSGFTQRSNLNRHKRIHTGEKPYKCDECGLGFIQRSQLNLHKTIHTGEKPYKCNECGSGFAALFNLNQHKLLHTGEKPYKCDECGLGFIQRSKLNLHKLKHTGERPYKCDECGSTFRQPSDLNKHKVIHTGEKPYKCDECGSGFTQRSNLKQHKLIHTGERPYKCDECGSRFRQQTSLNTHKHTHKRHTMQPLQM